MKRVWFSSEGVTQTLAALERTAQSLSVRHARVPVTILRTGMQAYCSRDGPGLASLRFLIAEIKFSLRTVLVFIYSSGMNKGRKTNTTAAAGKALT